MEKKTSLDKRHPDKIPLAMASAYAYAATVGTLLDRVLDRHTCVVEMTRLEPPKRRKTAVGIQAEKQNLSDTFAFGHLLQDICDKLPIQTVQDSLLPIAICLNNGNSMTFSKRSAVLNLRIEAELLMFIGQTSTNLAQAHSLQLRHFFYVSHLDGYQVKDHKDRRGGVVLFEIFKEYKSHFERYLDWRRELFPNSQQVFPFIRYEGGAVAARFQGHRLRALCKELSIQFVPPRSLRNTRVNWLLRSTGDPDLTAEMAQHTVQTLLGVYQLPSLQRAMIEATHFWSKYDPHSTMVEAVAPGGCNGTPKVISDIPKQAPKPDCSRASGCLWCESYRDIDSLDYVWALSSFRHLKVIELSKARSPRRDKDVPPAKLAIDRILGKLQWFEQSNDTRRGWVLEAEARIAEGDFHPSFQNEISELEGTA